MNILAAAILMYDRAFQLMNRSSSLRIPIQLHVRGTSVLVARGIVWKITAWILRVSYLIFYAITSLTIYLEVHRCMARCLINGCLSRWFRDTCPLYMITSNSSMYSYLWHLSLGF